MNEVHVLTNSEFGTIRTLIIDNEPWFVGTDVTKALGYPNNRQALIYHVDDEDKKMGSRNDTPPVKDSLGRTQYPSLINESGLYSLVLSSKLPTAQKFKRWVISMSKGLVLEGETTMNNTLQGFENKEFGTVRTLSIDGEPRFVGKDVAMALGYSNTRDAIAKHVDDDDKNTVVIRDGKGNPNQIIINESGLYSLVLSSKLPTAKKFKHWITSEVLPAIRKHGAYMTPEKIEEALLNPDTLIKLATELKAEREARKNAELEAASAKQVIGELKPKADYTDLILSNKSTVPVTAIAKDYGMSAKVFNEKLHELHVIYKLREQWLLYAKYQNKGYTHSKTFHLTLSNGRTACKMQTEWTQKGRLFLYQLLKKHAIIPMIERDDMEAEDLEKLR